MPYGQKAVWELMLDICSYPSWKSVIKSVDKLTWLSEAEAIAYFTARGGPISIEVVQRRVYTPMSRMTLSNVEGEGDVAEMEGAYNLQPFDSTHTLVHFYSAGRPKIWLPESIKRYFTLDGVRKDFADLNDELKRRAEARRHGEMPLDLTPGWYQHGCAEDD